MNPNDPGPNEMLEACRRAHRVMSSTHDRDEYEWAATDLELAFGELDAYLTTGGILPLVWQASAADAVESNSQTAYDQGKEDGQQQGFASGYRLAQQHVLGFMVDRHGFDPDPNTSARVEVCQCEHFSHDAHGREKPLGHAYQKAPAGTQRAQYVGLVCDGCASTHMAAFLLGPDDTTPTPNTRWS